MCTVAEQPAVALDHLLASTVMMICALQCGCAVESAQEWCLSGGCWDRSVLELGQETSGRQSEGRPFVNNALGLYPNMPQGRQACSTAAESGRSPVCEPLTALSAGGHCGHRPACMRPSAA